MYAVPLTFHVFRAFRLPTFVFSTHLHNVVKNYIFYCRVTVMLQLLFGPFKTEVVFLQTQISSYILGGTLCTRFDQFVYGRPITVQTDHKPLESIFKKSLLSAPKRLQRMLLQLQRYSLNIVYKPGKELFIADTLS